jgi:hypothetical protein
LYKSVPDDSAHEPLRIVGVIVDEVTEPALNGTKGSALYSIPFRLNRRPTSLWARLFVDTWNSPPTYTSRHRPGIASVSGSKIILNGTTIDEVKKYHRDTLIQCVEKANSEEQKILQQQQAEEVLRRKRKEEHRKSIEDGASDITFE